MSEGAPPRRAAGRTRSRRQSSRAGGRRESGSLGRRRVAAIGLAVVALFALVAVRLLDVQVASASRYVELGKSQLLHAQSLPAGRGSILDRNGQVLAMSIPQTTIVADPYQVTDPLAEAAALAPVLGQSQDTIDKELTEDAGFVYLARQVGDQVAARVRALKLAGITFEQEARRFDPDPTLASTIIGKVGIDGRGLSGLEYQYNSLLAGRPGKETLERGPNGSQIPGGVVSYDPSRPGQGLVLTLDQPLQYAAQTALAQQVARTDALGGTAIVLDTRTGGILAMANVSAGANGGPPVVSTANTAVITAYEPGSVMKGPVVSGALEDHTVSPSTTFDVPGQITVDGLSFHDAESHGVESLSVTDIIAQSSNIGAYEVASLMGKSRVEHYLQDFGFGKPTGLGFPGESEGLLLPLSKWSGTSIIDETIGQEEAVSPLQLVDAYNAIANGGVMVPPHLVSATIGMDGARHTVPLRPDRRIVSAQTAQEMTSMLEQVVQSPSGTANAAAIAGYTVAGKTGTAQKPGAGGYIPGAYMASFVGFVPAEQPALTALVVLNQPNSIYGGVAAAPVFAQVAQYGLRDLDIPPAGTPGAEPPGEQSGVPVGSSSPPVDVSKLHTRD